MVEIISLLTGVAFVISFMIFASSYVAFYLAGKQNVSESADYINMRDVENARRNSVRDEEVTNTELSVQDERPVPSTDDN